MLHSFLTYINEQNLFNATDKILLTVSGGKDSVAMFHLFCEANFPFAVAHCNFQLRGKESDADEIFVKKLCQTNGITFRSITFPTKAFAKEQKLSIEMAARQLRYQWFEQIRQESDCQYIATAHHLNDSIETVLLNLTKGTGISGLRGILPKKGFIIRPLLFASRAEIDAYVAEKQLIWQEDSSNASNDYQRNLLRNEVIPLLKQINPGLEHTFARNLERLQAVEIGFQENLSHFKKSIMTKENDSIYLKINTIIDWPSAGYLLEETLKEFGFNYFQSKEVYGALNKASGKIFHSSSHTLVKDREVLIITPKSEQVFEEAIIEQGIQTIDYHGIKLKFTLATPAEWQAYSSTQKDKNLLWLDADKLTFPLTLRPWHEGDWFMPLGMKGRKKISDFLVDTKTPLHLKKTTFLLTSNNAIVWVIGHRTDNRFKITETTRQILKVELL